MPSSQTPGADLSLIQISGRKIWLVSLYHYYTSRGLLAGFPQAKDWNVEHAVNAAERYCGKGNAPVAILRPRLTRLRIPERQGEPIWHGNPAYPLASLPPVTCIGEFWSDTVRDKDAFLSSAIVIWYQEAYGLPTDEHILAGLRELDWAKHAWDWDP
jgi:hypothetical protein